MLTVLIGRESNQRPISSMGVARTLGILYAAGIDAAKSAGTASAGQLLRESTKAIAVNENTGL
jgi:hypothetical protein